MRAFAPLRFREFRLLWLGQFTTAMGQWMDLVARGWLLYDLTGSPLQLGLVGVLRIFPLILLSPVAGTLADRYGRKSQLMTAQIINAVANAILGVLILRGGVEPWHIYVTGLVASTVQVFQNPARQAMVPEAVGPSDLTNAIALNSLAFNISRSLGPAVAGVVIAVVGPGGSYLTQALVFLLASVWTTMLRLPNRAPSSLTGRGGRRAESFLQGMRGGWIYAAGHETIRTNLLVSVVISFFGFSANSLLPVFAKDVLQVGPTGQGLLLTAMGLGGVASAFVLASVGDTLPKGLLMIGGVAVYGLANLAFSASPWFALSFALMLLLGCCNVAANTLNQTILQSVSAPEMRGRIMGIYQQHQVLIAAGGLAAGALASQVGAPWTVGSFGLACAVGAAAVFLRFPRVRALR
jgi:MFS family permease